MAMTLDHQDNRHLGAIGFDHLPYGNGPQFSNPWAATSSNAQSYPSMNTNNFGFDALVKQQSARAATSSLPYSSLPTSTSSLGPSTYTTAPYTQPILPLQQDLLSQSRPSYEQGYSAAPSIATFAPTPTPYTDAYGNLQPQQHDDRRNSHSSSVSSSSHSQTSYADALDAGRGMIALGQDMTTPRNIYGSRSDRGSNDGYGFPASHSSHSSISSASYTPSYYDSASIGSSASDYGSQSDHESVSSRTLPKPSSLLATNDIPPPQSMMGQFNSKISSSTQKKHKCKVCDKRFTRPSSLQTHMYSHTGEKPYACEVEGCGRHFSVVSNLRRHRKVHSCKGDMLSDHGSPEGSWMSDK